jgi:hypothetical protein
MRLGIKGLIVVVACRKLFLKNQILVLIPKGKGVISITKENK